MRSKKEVQRQRKKVWWEKNKQKINESRRRNATTYSETEGQASRLLGLSGKKKVW